MADTACCVWWRGHQSSVSASSQASFTSPSLTFPSSMMFTVLEETRSAGKEVWILDLQNTKPLLSDKMICSNEGSRFRLERFLQLWMEILIEIHNRRPDETLNTRSREYFCKSITLYPSTFYNPPHSFSISLMSSVGRLGRHCKWLYL